jgi:GAF domain-containing protein
MAEELEIIQGDKNEVYSSLIPQIKALIGDEKDVVANLANVSAALKQAFNFFWVGFYLVKEDELVLGPFQGPIACTRIKIGKGVCGSSWQEKKVFIVDDVDAFPGHIACSGDSKSEIVLPLIKNNVVIGVLDIDSDEYATFDKTDELHLTQLTEWLVSIF